MTSDGKRRQDDSRTSFTRAGYRSLLERALKLGYEVTTFRSWSPPGSRPLLLLRHDIDHSLRSALTIAEIEAEYEVAATYFVQVTSDFYNILCGESRQILRRIGELGHEIGLHYESSRYLDDKGHAHLECDLRILEDIVEQPMVSAAQHIPIDSEPIDLGDFIENEAYEPRFTEPPMAYLSDSSMAWRRETPFELLDATRSFQLLIHPVWWIGEFNTMDEAMEFACDEECATVRRRYADTAAYYARNLADRLKLDQRFRERMAVAKEVLSQSTGIDRLVK